MTKRFENQYYFFGALLLALGDVLALLLFTFFGTMEHQMDSGFVEIWRITLPFILAWLGSGLVVGSYRWKAYSNFAQAFAATFRTSILALPAGLILRYFMYDKPATWMFTLVAFVFIFIFLLLWRSAYTWLVRNM